MLNFQASAEWERYRNSHVPCSPESKGPHCVEHLFIHCKHESLALPRSRLFRVASTRNLNTIVTRHPQLAANFAITNFGIEQFSVNRSWKNAVKRPCTESEPLPPQKKQRTLAPGSSLMTEKARWGRVLENVLRC
ncbi:hypothetical protein MKX08_002755 [Trichoderma sp. CBMAI-0020]|nr:hypothetical protein MKX08_002755 [Trichoderma sp. CBMAI-0020]